MHIKVEKVLISEEQIEEGIEKAANWINTEYKDKKVIFLGILKGCIPFIGKILPLIKIECEIEFITASSFKGGTEALDEVSISDDIKKLEMNNKHVIILEDIIDTARTLSKVRDYINRTSPASLRIVTLLDKKEKRIVDLNADFSCFEIPDVFIVGFGLDYKEELRNLPYIGIFNKKYI